MLYAEATAELRELAELLGAAVMTTLPGKSAFPEDHPLSVGAGGVSGPKAAAHFLREADVVLGAGASFTISNFAAPIPGAVHKTMIQITVDERDLNKDYAVEHPLIGDARLVLRQLIDEIKRQTGSSVSNGGGRAGEIAALKEETLARWRPKLESDETPLNPYRVIRELQRAVDPARTIITHDSGNPRDQLAPFWMSPRRTATSAGASRRTSATASVWRWAPSWPRPTSYALT